MGDAYSPAHVTMPSISVVILMVLDVHKRSLVTRKI